jgi:hypothetical protein
MASRPCRSAAADDGVRRGLTEHKDLGPDYFDRVNVAKLRRYHLRRLADLGCDVSALAKSA